MSHALLRRVARGELPETLRLYAPDDVVVFSLLDAKRKGFPEALKRAEEAGCQSVLRLGGGHAALFHRHCLAFSWAIPDPRARDGIRERFEIVSRIVQRGLRRVGVNAEIGAIPGEYCPGDYSVNADTRIKLMGVGQRIIQGAAHLGGVIVVRDSARLRKVLTPVYAALDLAWDPATAGAVEDATKELQIGSLQEALLSEWAIHRPIEEVPFDTRTTALARELEPWHDPGRTTRPDAAFAASVHSKTLALSAREFR
jgi:lipoate-protein ligase A